MFPNNHSFNNGIQIRVWTGTHNAGKFTEAGQVKLISYDTIV
jgi:hypothetical protein